jgi:hypothetical protein
VSEYGVMRLTRAYASAMGDLKYMVRLVSIDIHNQSSLEHKMLQYKKFYRFTCLISRGQKARICTVFSCTSFSC